MGAPQKSDWRKARRRRAWALKEQGWQQKEIALAPGVSDGAASQWLKRGREGGEETLVAQPVPGMVPRLTAEQKRHLPYLLARGAETSGFSLGKLDQNSIPARIQLNTNA